MLSVCPPGGDVDRGDTSRQGQRIDFIELIVFARQI